MSNYRSLYREFVEKTTSNALTEGLILGPFIFKRVPKISGDTATPAYLSATSMELSNDTLSQSPRERISQLRSRPFYSRITAQWAAARWRYRKPTISRLAHKPHPSIASPLSHTYHPDHHQRFAERVVSARGARQTCPDRLMLPVTALPSRFRWFKQLQVSTEQ